MTACDQLIAEIRANILVKREHNENMLASNKKIETLLTSLLSGQKNVSEKYIVNGNTILKGDYYEVPPVNSAGFERARIFTSVGFNENTSAGVSIDLYYAGHRIGEILAVSPTQAGMSAGSEAFDINQLAGFNLMIINHDPAQEVKINTMRIVLYNE